MKHLATAIAALAMLACGAAHADEPRAPVAHPVKKMTLKQCTKLADDRKLDGTARADYIKECRTKNAPVNPNPHPASAPPAASAHAPTVPAPGPGPATTPAPR